MKIKNFNPDEEKEEEIKEVKKDNSLLFDKPKLKVGTDKIDFLFSIYGFHHVYEKYAVEYRNTIILLYLRELGLFTLEVKVFDKTFRLGEFLTLGYVCEHYSNKAKRIYKLTGFGNEIVESFFKVLSDKDSIIQENRATEIEYSILVKKIINNYLNE